MKSATSFFNRGVFVKSVLRFWPIWAIYAFVQLLVLPLNIIAPLSTPVSGHVNQQVIEAAAYVPRQLGAENSDPEIGCGKQAHCPQPLQQRGQPGEAEDRLRGQGYEEDEDICGQQRQQARQGE